MNQRGKVFNLVIGAMFVALTAIGANMTSIVPFLVVGGVPITLQTLFAANSIFIRNYLTTEGQERNSDFQMLKDLGFEIDYDHQEVPV